MGYRPGNGAAILDRPQLVVGFLLDYFTVGFLALGKLTLTFFLRAHRGQYWGNMGFFYIVMGKNSLGIESEVAWATPGSFTIKNFPCNEDGSNCHRNGAGMEAHVYKDPSLDPAYIKAKRHLQA